MDDTPKAKGNTARKKGKMYWKFATLEGWQAKKESSGAADPKADDAAKKETDRSSDESGLSGG
tara:strand:+ start:510 stop:698 length:189 start_codon:yes stop_codon:yes gene_type:complete